MIKGLICLWSGAIVDIPAGWALCDGNNGTPDLRDRFIIGAGLTYNPDDTGGVTWHNHPFTGDGHSHDLPAGTNIIDSTPSGGISHISTSSPAAGTTAGEYHLPPYFALCYIMKL